MDLTKETLVLVDLYEVTLSTGEKLFLTSHSEALVVSGNTYIPAPVTRSRIGKHTDMQIDSTSIRFGIHSFFVSGKTIVEAARLGWFDGAEVIIWIVNPLIVTEISEIFRGYVSKGVKTNRKEIVLKAASLLDMLQEQVPGWIYQEQCNHKLWDPQCQLVKATYRQTGTAEAGSTKTRIIHSIFSFVTNPSGFFVLGEIRMTAGANAGISRTIRLHNDGSVDAYYPFDHDIVAGDAFDVWPGCDKAGTTCQAKYNNYTNFSGFEYIPPPETLF